MDPRLVDRLRSIVRAPGAHGQAPVSEVEPPADFWHEPGAANATDALGGDWHRRDGLTCFVVERRFDPRSQHGHECLRTIGTRLADSFAQVSLLMGPVGALPRQMPAVFFDLETTGLSGGAGTLAFLAGCGSFALDGAFVTRQFVLLRHADERQLLQMLAAELAQAGLLVTFNGKSYDVPVIETRYMFHRLQSTMGELPHLDLLHPARRFWGGVSGAGCSLTALEGQLLGVERAGDIRGADIPTRYFQFLRTGDARKLDEVLRHNRLDLLSLAVLTATLLDLLQRGPQAARDAREALALGHAYARSGLTLRSRDAYERALDGGAIEIRQEAARALALSYRRARRWNDAASFWRRLLDMPSCPPHVIREASEALAIHHEHRVRDLAAAKAFAVGSLKDLDSSRPARAWRTAVTHRLERIERKLRGTQAARFDFQEES